MTADRDPVAGRGSHHPLTDAEIGERLYVAEMKAVTLTARVATLEAALRELVEYMEEQDPYPTSDGHPLYAAREALEGSHDH